VKWEVTYPQWLHLMDAQQLQMNPTTIEAFFGRDEGYPELPLLLKVVREVCQWR
jgi:hypothetical protein